MFEEFFHAEDHRFESADVEVLVFVIRLNIFLDEVLHVSGFSIPCLFGFAEDRIKREMRMFSRERFEFGAVDDFVFCSVAEEERDLVGDVFVDEVLNHRAEGCDA